MSHSLSCNYIHLIFSTKYREQYITPDAEPSLYAYIKGTCENLESPVVAIGGMPDHIHILLRMSKNVSLVTLVKEIKVNSSKWIKQQNNIPHFYWQIGYGAFSVSPQNTIRVYNYILNQKEHHKQESFQQEYLTILKQSKADFDERYIWD